MKIRTIIFYALIVVYSIFLLLLFLKIFPITIDKFSIVFLVGFIGISLLPFAYKLKIGSFIEFERLKEKVEKVEETQYLGEVLKTKTGELFYYDNEGLHCIPDKETADFLKSRKGIIDIKVSEFKALHNSFNLESVLSADLLMFEGIVFVILNNKKYYVSSWAYIVDWARSKNEVKNISSDDIKKIPTAK